MQASIGFWNSIFANLGHLRHIFFPFEKLKYIAISPFRVLNTPNRKHNKIFSIFIRSLNHNFENLSELLANLDFQFHIISFSESWNPKTKAQYFIPPILNNDHHFEGVAGYSNNSGCGIYILDNLAYIRRHDLKNTFFALLIILI